MAKELDLTEFGGAPQLDLSEFETVEPEQDNPLKRGWNKMKQSVGLTSDLATGNYGGAAQRMADMDNYQRKNPGSVEGQELMQAWNKGDGIVGGLGAVGDEFSKDWNASDSAFGKMRSVGRNLSAMGAGVIEQTPNMLAPMAGMLAGGAAGSLASPVVGTAIGGWAGASLGNTAVEGGGMAQDALQKAGINPQDKAATRAYLEQNGDKILTEAGIKGSIIGAVDTATMGLGHALLSAPAKAAAGRAAAAGIDITDKVALKAAMQADPIYQAAGKGAGNLARNTGVAALEPIGEGVGEYVGQGVATGDWNEKNAFLEAASSIGQSGATFAGQKLYQGVKYPFANQQPPDTTIPGSPPAQQQGTQPAGGQPPLAGAPAGTTTSADGTTIDPSNQDAPITPPGTSPATTLSPYGTNDKGEFPGGPRADSDVPERWKTQGVYRNDVPDYIGDKIVKAFYSGDVELAQKLADQLPDPQDDWDYRYYDGVRLDPAVVGGLRHVDELTVRGMPLSMWQNDVSVYKSTAPKRTELASPTTQEPTTPTGDALFVDYDSDGLSRIIEQHKDENPDLAQRAAAELDRRAAEDAAVGMVDLSNATDETLDSFLQPVTSPDGQVDPDAAQWANAAAQEKARRAALNPLANVNDVDLLTKLAAEPTPDGASAAQRLDEIAANAQKDAEVAARHNLEVAATADPVTAGQNAAINQVASTVGQQGAGPIAQAAIKSIQIGASNATPDVASHIDQAVQTQQAAQAALAAADAQKQAAPVAFAPPDPVPEPVAPVADPVQSAWDAMGAQQRAELAAKQQGLGKKDGSLNFRGTNLVLKNWDELSPAQRDIVSNALLKQETPPAVGQTAGEPTNGQEQKAPETAEVLTPTGAIPSDAQPLAASATTVQAPDSVPAASINQQEANDGTQAEETFSQSQGRAQAEAAGAAVTPIAQGRPQPTQLGTQTTATAGPGFDAGNVGALLPASASATYNNALQAGRALNTLGLKDTHVAVKRDDGKFVLQAKATEATDGASKTSSLSREQFIALPDDVRQLSRSLADVDIKVKELADYTSRNPRSTEKQIQQISELTDYKNQLLSAGAIQSAADHINEFRNKAPTNSEASKPVSGAPVAPESAPPGVAKQPTQVATNNVASKQIGRDGYDTQIEVDASQLKTFIEATRGEPLVNKPEKLEAWRNGTARTDVSKFPIEVGFNSRGNLDVNDGRHRIALAAERGEKVKVFIDGADASKLKSVLSQPNNTPTASDASAPQAKAQAVISTSETTAAAAENVNDGDVIARYGDGKGGGLGEIAAKIAASKARKSHPNDVVTIEDAGYALSNGKQAFVVTVRAAPKVTGPAQSASDQPQAQAQAAQPVSGTPVAQPNVQKSSVIETPEQVLHRHYNTQLANTSNNAMKRGALRAKLNEESRKIIEGMGLEISTLDRPNMGGEVRAATTVDGMKVYASAHQNIGKEVSFSVYDEYGKALLNVINGGDDPGTIKGSLEGAPVNTALLVGIGEAQKLKLSKPVATPLAPAAPESAPAGVAATPAPAASDTAPAPAAQSPLRVGRTPKDTEPVSVIGGVVHIGKYPAVSFEGEDVTVPDGASDAQIKQALIDAKALGSHSKIFGGSTTGIKPATAPQGNGDVVDAAVMQFKPDNAIIRGALNKPVKGIEGTATPIKTFVYNAVQAGATVQTKAGQRVLEMKDGGEFTEAQLTKPGMDFAEYLVRQRATAIEPEPVAPAAASEAAAQPAAAPSKTQEVDDALSEQIAPIEPNSGISEATVKAQYRTAKYWLDNVVGALENYFEAYRAMGAERLERSSIKPAGLSATEWIEKLRKQESSWDRGRKTGLTGTQLLSQKGLWPTVDGKGEVLRKSMLAVIGAIRKSPGSNVAWMQMQEDRQGKIELGDIFSASDTPSSNPIAPVGQSVSKQADAKPADALTEDAKQPASQEYRYAMVNRPFGISTAPKDGFLRTESRPTQGEPHHDTARNGVAVYNRELTDEETKQFEMAPMANEQQFDKAASAVAADMSDYAAQYLDMAQAEPEDFADKVAERLKATATGYRPSVGNIEQFVELVRAKLEAGVADVVKPATPAAPDDGFLTNLIRESEKRLADLQQKQQELLNGSSRHNAWILDEDIYAEQRVLDELRQAKAREAGNETPTDVQDAIKNAVSVDHLSNDQVDQVAAIFGAKTPEQPAPKLTEKERARIRRDTEKTVYNDLKQSPDMVGKSVDEIKQALLARATDSTPETIDKMAAELHKEIQKNQAEIERQKHRDPSVLEAAMSTAMPNGMTPESYPQFQIGFTHALAGKTKSTLAGDGLDAMISGYEAAQKWIKTPVGQAFYEGVPVNKLQNTGIDLRRHWELMKANMKANESDIQKAWASIEKATDRASFFSPILTDGVTPGLRLYVTTVRDSMTTFKKWLAKTTRWYGHYSYNKRKAVKTDIEYMLDGERYPGELNATDQQKWKTDSAYRADYLRNKAEEYIKLVADHVGFLQGQTSVKDAATSFSEQFMAENPENGSYWQNIKLTDKGERVYKHLFDGSRHEFQNLRSTSDWTQALIEKEDTVALPNRATPLTPPKLDRVTRSGLSDHRNGQDVTPEKFKATFGFADVGFGTWVGSKQDQDHLNYAYDAFSDLAKHFGIAAKNVGMGIHFTIGALGHGKYSAHFSPKHPGPTGDVQVINLTNTRGDGAVYHEWVHALDHNLGGQWQSAVRGAVLAALTRQQPTIEALESRAKQFLLNGSYWKSNKNMDKVQAAIQGINYFKPHATVYKQNADALGKDYWGNDEELIARAAEAWAADTLGGDHSYLVNAQWVGDGNVTAAKGYRGTPYPTGDERQHFNNVFTALSKAVTSDDSGKPVVTLADFERELNTLNGDIATVQAYKKKLQTTEGMTELRDRILAEKADAEQAKIDEQERLAAEKMAELEAELAAANPPVIDPPKPDAAPGPLTEDDLNAIFDQAAAELREEQQEQPQAPAPAEQQADPGPEFDRWTIAELRELQEKAHDADLIALSGGGGIPNVLTIHEVAALGHTEHKGFGMFETTGVDENGKRWTISWEGGGEMRRLSSGKPYTNVSLTGPGVAPFPSGIKRAIEAEIDRLASLNRKPSSIRDRISLNQEQQAEQKKQAKEDPRALAAIAEAAKLGVTGVSEAFTALTKLFGSAPGRLNSFPAGFDEEAYAAAKPHFQKSLEAFQQAGKTLKDLFKFLIQNFGEGIQRYAVRFAKEQGLTNALGDAAKASPSSAVAEWVQGKIASGTEFKWQELFDKADQAWGGTQAQGKYTPKDAYDAMEMGMNRYILANPTAFNPNAQGEVLSTVARLQRLTQLLATQTKRTEEMDEFQQFSTVPAFSFVANWVSGVRATDVMLEPSAGVGGLAVFAKNAGAQLVLNELSSRRAAVLQEVFPSAQVFHENAEQINNILPPEIRPTVVVMNPPFSASAGRAGSERDTKIGARHVEQALERLADGGRLVAIVGEGMAADKPAFKAWWKKIGDKYDVRAIIPVDGKGYAKYGTTFSNALLVIDKVKPSGRSIVTTPASDYAELAGLLSEIRNDRPATIQYPDTSTQRDDAESARKDTDDAGGRDTEPGQDDSAGTPGVGDGKSLRKPRSGGGGGGGGRGGRSTKPGGGVPKSDGRPASDAGADAGTSSPSDGGNNDLDVSGVSLTSNATDAAELTDSVFENYQPQRLQIEGSQAHLGALVQSAAMASVLPPAATYVPNLPIETITEGKLSLAQLEAVVYAGQAHQEFLEDKPHPKVVERHKVNADQQYRKGFFIGDGCVAAWTRIYDPVAKTHTPIETLAKEGKPITVLSLTPQGLQPTFATAPFKKGTAHLHRVRLSSGREVTVTDHHRFFTPDGWQTLAAGLTVGHFLASVEGHPASSLGFYPPTHDEDGLHSMQTVEGCLDDCLRSDYQRGVRLLTGKDNDQSSVPSLACALEHTHFCQHGGAQALSQARSHHHQESARHSRNSFSPSESRDHALTSTPCVEDGALLLAEKHQAVRQFHSKSAQQNQPALLDDQDRRARAHGLSERETESECAVFSADFQRSARSRQIERQVQPWSIQQGTTQSLAAQTPAVSNGVVFSSEYYSRWDRIASIEYVGLMDFYDMYVPGPENYVAEGIVHHNTGLGKGREIGGIILDNLRQGRKKAIWISEKQGLMNDAKLEFAGIGGDEKLVFNLSDGAKDRTEGVMFTTYSTLRVGSNDTADANKKGGKEASERFSRALAIVESLDVGDAVKVTFGLNGRDSIKQYSAEITYKYPKNGNQVPKFEYRITSNGEDYGKYIDRVSPDFESTAELHGLAPKAVKVNKAKPDAISRIQEIINWVGPDFDGVIAFDESHNGGNAVSIKGDRGTSDPSKQALAMLELQARLPKARVIYVSATGATTVENLAYAARLGLWGAGTPFPTVQNFVSEMQAGGLATMELVARDMKQMGVYMARSLSFDGVTYGRIDHELSDLQTDAYNVLANAWKLALKNINQALEATGAVEAGHDGERPITRNKEAKKNAMTAYWGAQLRFFNQIITSMQMPSVLEQMERDIEAGNALILQLVNTNEAQQNRAMNERVDGDADASLEDLDLTPKAQLLGMIEKSFPTAQMEEYEDENGNKLSRVVRDSKGEIVQNAEAVAMKNQLMSDIENIHVFPDGPLEMVLNHFGVDTVAEVTGRSQRIVRKKDANGETRATLEKRGSGANRADADAFMADKKRILIFSDAGGTGFSFHADKTKPNQRKRSHYLIQPGWRADKAVQGFGRSHRTNQKSAPHYWLASTSVPAHKRFLSAIARRLDMLGAMTKGQRDTANQGLFSEKDNLDSKYAQQAVAQLFTDARNGQLEGMSFDELADATGLANLVDPNTGGIAEAKMPKTSQFLNRMSSMPLDVQEMVFTAFISRMEEKIDVAIQRGELDAGLETIKAISTKVASEDVVFTDPKSGAETRLISLEMTLPTIMYPLPKASTQGGRIEWVKNVKSGRVWGKVLSGTTTLKNGDTVPRYRMLGTGGTQIITQANLKTPDGKDTYTKIDAKQAEELWDKETQARPATHVKTQNMIVGAILPIWDRLKTDSSVLRVMRTQTEDNRRILGRVIEDKDIAEIRKRLNVTSPAAKMTPLEVMRLLIQGQVGELANGWKLQPVNVSGDLRIEITGSMVGRADVELKRMGVMRERINWADRYFIPVGTEGVPVLTQLFKSKPLVDLISNKASRKDAANTTDAPDTNTFSTRESAPKTPLTVQATQAMVTQALSRTKGAVNVRVVASPDAIGITAPAGTVASGMVDADGNITIFANGVGNAADVERVVFHELFHRGLQNTLAKSDYAATLLGMAKAEAIVQQAADAWKASKAGIAKLAALRKAGALTPEAQTAYDALAVEEGLARIAESLKADRAAGTKSMRLRKLASWLARIADKFGLTKLADHIRAMTYSDAEKFVIDTIGKADATAQQGAQARFATSNKPLFRAPEVRNAAGKLLAPNGEESKLTEGQWHQVRSPEFKVFFGDWENDAKNASKVIDPVTKEPMVVTHTTNTPWTVFDKSKASGSAVWGKGIYLATNSIWNRGKNTELIQLFLDSKNPLDITKPLSDSAISALSKYAGRNVDAAPLLTMERKSGSVADGAKAAGFDSIIHIGPGATGIHIVAFNPTQIKSATNNNGNFDPTNPDIRFRTADADQTTGFYSEKAEDGVPMFSRKQAIADAPPVDRSIIDALISSINGVRQAAGDARITVTATPSELPVKVLEQAKLQGVPENEIHGVLYKGRAYIVHSNLKSKADVEEVLLHEIFGHGGVNALLGDAKKTVLAEAFNRAGGVTGLRAAASRLGVLKELNLRIPDGKLTGKQKIAVVDEMLSLAQGKTSPLQQVALTWWNKVRNFVVGALNKLGFAETANRLDKFDASEAAVMLRQMRQAVIDGGDIGGHGVSFMTAWHGSPHKFDKFSTEHIGTGEGAQAYGWGIYFSSAKDVASWYKDNLTKYSVELDGIAINPLKSGRGALMEQFNWLSEDEASTLNSIVGSIYSDPQNRGVKGALDDAYGLRDFYSSNIDKVSPENITRAQSKIDDQLAKITLLEKLNTRLSDAKGNLYQVELAPKADDFLDWYKPLSEQSDAVNAALKSIRQGLDVAGLLDEYLERKNADWDELTGKELYKQILDRAHRDDALGLFDLDERSDKAASLYLKSIGIPGIRYLDGPSRSAGQGNYNYVIFDDADVSVTIRYSRQAPTKTAAENRRAFMQGSKIVNPDGTPKIMYHGTARDITKFAPKQADAIFLTDNPEFAAGFAGMSEWWMIEHYEQILPSDIVEKIKTDAKNVKSDGKWGYNRALRHSILANLPTGQNIMPLIVNAQNPFDYENAEHIEALRKQGIDSKTIDDIEVGVMEGSIEGGVMESSNWRPIESKEVQAAIKAAGFDGFYVKENGVRNLAVYKSEQIKSATGNIGTYDRTNPDVRYSFAGQRAATADTHALSTAQQRLAAGEDAETVRQDTGWFTGAADGKWRFEINDADAKLKIGHKGSPLRTFAQELVRSLNRPLNLSDILNHPALFAAYPALSDYGVTFVPAQTLGTARGALSDKQVTLSDDMAANAALSTLLHEIQHAIQNVEGFASGGTPSVAAWTQPKMRKLLLQEVAKGMRDAQPPSYELYWGSEHSKEGDESYAQFLKQWKSPAYQKDLKRAIELGAPSKIYNKLYGEVEARNTQTRQKLTDAERREQSPESTADVPAKDVIVVFNGTEMHSAPVPANAQTETAQPDFTPTTVAALQQAIKDLTGAVLPNHLGRIVAATADEIKSTWEPLIGKGVNLESEGNAGKAQAFFDLATNTVFLISDNIQAGTEKAVLAHELMHRHGRAVLGESGWNKLHEAISGWATAAPGSNERRVYEAAAASVQAVGAELSNEELFPYAVEAALNMGIKPNAMAAQGTLAKWLAQVKQALRDVWAKLTGKPELFNAQDMVDLAYAIAQIERHDVGSAAQANKAQRAGDIRYSRAASLLTGQDLPHSWQAPDATRLDDFIYSVQDKHIDTKRVLDSVEKIIGAIDEQQNPYLQEELYHGRASKATKDFLEHQIRPLLRELRARGVKMEDLETYLHNRHAERRNIQIAKINKDMPDGGSGINTADARAYLAALTPEQNAAFKSLAAKVDAINKATRNMLVSSGLEKPETIAAWERAYGDEYVPLQREEMENGMGIGQGISVRGSASKRAMGSDKKVVDIFANIVMAHERAITRSEKKRVGEALYGLVLKAPNPDFWFAIDPALQQSPSKVMDTMMQLVNLGLDPADAESIAKEPTTRYVSSTTGMVESRINPAMRNAENVLAVRINGEDKFVFFNKKDERAMRMVKALKNLDSDQLGEVMGAVSKATRYFSAINTQFNPIFGVVNIMRDFQTGMINLQSTALKGKQKAVARHVVPALLGIYSDLRNNRAGKAATSAYAQLFEEFQREGGATGFRDMYANAQERATSIQDEINDIAAGKAKQLAKGLFGWLSDYNEAMENAVRLSAYKVAKENGMSNQQAASLAKNLTVNFNRKGQVALQAGALYAFFNASVQGTARIAQTLTTDGKLSKVGKKIIAGGLLLGAMQALLLAAAGFEDDEPPDFVRERSLVIPSPFGDKKYLSIPMPLGFHVIPGLSRIFTEWALSGGENTPKRLAQIAGMISSAMNPIGSAGMSMQTLAPTVLDPFAALTENKDWTGKPIAKLDFNSLRPTAGHTRAKDTASPWATFLSKAVNYATGGDEYKPGVASPTPDQIDYLLGQISGGVGREVSKISQVVSSAATGEELPMYKTPLFGRFVGTTEGNAAESSRFYENLKKIGVHKASIDGLRKDGRGLEISGYLQENPEARLLTAATHVQDRVSNLNKLKRTLIKRDAPPEKIKEINAQITGVMTRFNEMTKQRVHK